MMSAPIPKPEPGKLPAFIFDDAIMLGGAVFVQIALRPG